MSVSVWVSKIFFKTGFSGLDLGFGFRPWSHAVLASDVKQSLMMLKPTLMQIVISTTILCSSGPKFIVSK